VVVLAWLARSVDLGLGLIEGGTFFWNAIRIAKIKFKFCNITVQYHLSTFSVRVMVPLPD